MASDEPETNTKETEDIAALAKGGRTNVFGFLLRLAARLPFLFIAGRMYGPEALGRFAYAILIVEFAAQLATLGLRRGLAEQLSSTKRPHVHVVWDGITGVVCRFRYRGDNIDHLSTDYVSQQRDQWSGPFSTTGYFHNCWRRYCACGARLSV